MQPFVRQPDGSYDVLSSTGTFYYEVIMLSGHAVSCQCPHFQRGHIMCKHMKLAEQEEAKWQGFHLDAPLNGNAGFSFFR